MFVIGLFLLVGLVAAVVYVGAAGPRRALRQIDAAAGAVFRRIGPRTP